MRWSKFLPLTLFAALVVGFGSARPPAVRAADAPAAVVRKDLSYYAGEAADARSHLLDLYLPEGKKGFPMILFIYGGAWQSGSKDLYGPLAQNFVRQGIGVAVANYRLSPAVKHPEHERDVARAFAWLAKHAKEYDADPARLYVMGHSAGAHLVALLALDPRYLKAEGLTGASIRGVIGVSGPYTLPPGLMEKVFGADEAKRQDAFPLTHITDQEAKAIPPFLIQAADGDYPGLPEVAKQCAAALEKHGVKARQEVIAGRDHISIIVRMTQADDPAVKQIVEFVSP
jgi:acetyl esterase/lipase